MIDLADLRFVSLPGVFVSGGQKFEELLEVTLVVAQRVRAHISLVAKVIEKLSEKLVEHRGTDFSL